MLHRPLLGSVCRGRPALLLVLLPACLAGLCLPHLGCGALRQRQERGKLGWGALARKPRQGGRRRPAAVLPHGGVKGWQRGQGLLAAAGSGCVSGHPADAQAASAASLPHRGGHSRRQQPLQRRLLLLRAGR